MRVPVLVISALSIVAPIACDHGPTAPSSSPPLATAISFTSSPGDRVGQGQFKLFEPSLDTEIGGDMWDDNNALQVIVMIHAPRYSDWILRMKAPTGQRLVPGTYSNVRSPSIGSPNAALEFYGEGRACNGATGSFEVFEAVYGPQPVGSGTSGTIERFRARFSQVCDGSSAPLTGEVTLASLPRGCKITGNC